MDKIIKKTKSVTPVFNSSFNGSATLYLLNNIYNGRISDNRCALIYTINGIVTVKTDCAKVLNKGNILLVNDGDNFTVKSVGKDKANCVIITFNDSFFDYGKLLKPSYLSKISDATAIYVYPLISNLGANDITVNITVKNILFALLNDVINSSLIYNEKVISELAKHFRNCADDYLLNCERIYDVYKRYAVSHTSLIKEFKSLTGQTPIEYVAIKRLEGACNLLSNTTLSVEEISNCLDYNSVSHFIKKFKSVYNTTPLSYRKNIV